MLVYYSLYAFVMGVALSMLYINYLNVPEKDFSSSITMMIFLVALFLFWANYRKIEFMKIIRYSCWFFISLFLLYIIVQLANHFSDYDLYSYHGVVIFVSIFFIWYLVYFFKKTRDEAQLSQ